jgi:hypothetical protein
MVLGLTISSDRSTLVRCCPSEPVRYIGIAIGLVLLAALCVIDRRRAKGFAGAYRVRAGKLLFSGDGTARTTSSIQSRLAANDFFLGCSTTGTDFASDLGNGIPILISHVLTFCSRKVKRCVKCRWIFRFGVFEEMRGEVLNVDVLKVFDGLR